MINVSGHRMGTAEVEAALVSSQGLGGRRFQLLRGQISVAVRLSTDRITD